MCKKQYLRALVRLRRPVQMRVCTYGYHDPAHKQCNNQSADNNLYTSHSDKTNKKCGHTEYNFKTSSHISCIYMRSSFNLMQQATSHDRFIHSSHMYVCVWRYIAAKWHVNVCQKYALRRLKSALN